MHNAKWTISNANDRRERRRRHDRPHRLLVWTLCIVHCAFIASCAKTPPPVQPVTPAAASVPASPIATRLSQLRTDILAAVTAPGVQRGTWGIVVHSLDRNERLFELNPRTLLVPASVAKL